MISGSSSASNAQQLEPMLHLNVMNNEGDAQGTTVTNLGGLGKTTASYWPPNMSMEQTFFGGAVLIDWLFTCDGFNVYLEVTVQ